MCVRTAFEPSVCMTVPYSFCSARWNQELMTSRQQNQKRQQEDQRKKRKRKETLCERMAGFLKALGLESKPEYAEKIPETLTEGDFHVHDVSLAINRGRQV